MKDLLKRAIKIISIIAILCGVVYGGYRYLKAKAENNKGPGVLQL